MQSMRIAHAPAAAAADPHDVFTAQATHATRNAAHAAVAHTAAALNLANAAKNHADAAVALVAAHVALCLADNLSTNPNQAELNVLTVNNRASDADSTVAAARGVVTAVTSFEDIVRAAAAVFDLDGAVDAVNASNAVNSVKTYANGIHAALVEFQAAVQGFPVNVDDAADDDDDADAAAAFPVAFAADKAFAAAESATRKAGRAAAAAKSAVSAAVTAVSTAANITVVATRVAPPA